MPKSIHRVSNLSKKLGTQYLPIPVVTTDRIQSQLRILAFRIIAASIRTSSTTNKSRAALICPCAPPGSLGDAAMITALRDALKETGFERVAIIEYGRAGSWSGVTSFDESVVMPERRFREWRRFARQVVTYGRVYVIGADCLDGHYSPSLSKRLLEVGAFGAICGAHATICGSSFNATPAPAVLATLATMPKSLRLLARDPISFRRMNGKATCTLQLVADLAFMLNPSAAKIPSTIAWSQSQHAKGRFVLGVNAASIFLSPDQRGRIDELIARFADAIRTTLMTRAEVSILLVPHDVRGNNSDASLCRRVRESIASEFGDRLELYTESMEPDALKAVAGLLDACVTCRMHFAIACLGMGVPVGVIPYQGKFEGLFEHFEMSPPVLPAERFFEAGSLEVLVKRTVESARDLAGAIALKKSEISRLSRLNLGLQEAIPGT